MRADGRPPHQDFPWRSVIRSEMQIWRPTGLPEHFTPRRQRQVGSMTMQRMLLPIAVAAAALAAAMVTYLRAPVTRRRADGDAVHPRRHDQGRAHASAVAQPKPPVTTAARAQPRSAPVERATVAPAPEVVAPACRST